MSYQNINQYTNIEYVQRGGTSYIYKAIHSYSKQNIVIKLSVDSNKEHYLLHESQILAQLNHKNIVKLLDVNKIGKTLYLVLESLSGKTLQKYVEEHYPLNYNDILDIFEQLCYGIQHMHHLNIVHRDLSPKNIFVCNNGTIKILDFGLSNINGIDIQKTNNIIGTIDYMSPEQLLNSSLIDKRSDIYSLGAILYFLFSGKTMFNDRDKNIKARKKILAHYYTLSINNPDIEELFNSIIYSYRYFGYNIDQIIKSVSIKQIINKWNYVKN